MQDANGNVPWRGKADHLYGMRSPLDTLEITLHARPVFPGPGNYSLVLVANDEELCREPFSTRLKRQNMAG